MVRDEQEFRIRQERAELDAMVERLGRSPRLANLLRYVGDRYLAGDAGQLREHNIAIEVFGRPRTFDPSQDAIARVEAHRLRKKLKLYYETEGQHSPIRIRLPAGTYVLAFEQRTAASPEPEPIDEPATPPPVIPEAPAPALPPPVSESHESSPNHAGRYWLLAALAALVVVALVLSRQTSKSASPAISGTPNTAAAFPPSDAIRLLAGYTGPLHVDPAGAVWAPDRFFDRGGGWLGSTGFTARTNDPVLFQTVRTGDFTYNIPLNDGVYELHLYFVEPGFGPGLGGGEGSRSFNVLANGVPLLPAFDIESDAGGPNIADERVFKDVRPAKDGQLHVGADSLAGKPILSALAVLPGIPHKQIPIRLTTQPGVYIDHAGQRWNPDNYYYGGQPSIQRPPVTGTSEPGLFAMERYGHFNYAIPVDTRGLYTLVLHFAEFYFGPQALGRGGVGSRVFNVSYNGGVLLRDFDIFKEAGSLHAVTKTFQHLRPTAQGKLNLTFEPVANYANVSAIEVLDESQ